MAFPSVNSVNPAADSSTGGAATNGSTAADSHSVVLPATITAGDLLLMFGRVAGAGTVAVTGGGWTIVQDDTDSSDDVTFWAYRDALADGTEDGSSITVTHGTSQKMCAITYAISGAQDPATQPPETSTVAIGSSTTVDATTCTPTGGAKDYLWMYAYMFQGESTLSKTAASGYTDRADCSSGTGGLPATNTQLKTGDRTNNAASENPGSITISVSNPFTAWCLAIHPFVAPTANPPPILVMARR